jgi:hypothetical protein
VAGNYCCERRRCREGSFVGLDASGAMTVKVTRGDGSVIDMTNQAPEGNYRRPVRRAMWDIPASMARVDTLPSTWPRSRMAFHQAGFGLDGLDGPAAIHPPPTAIAGTGL